VEAARVLLIGRAQSNGSSLANALKKKYDVLHATSGKHGTQLAQQEQFQLIVLDAVSMRTPGERICYDLRRVAGAASLVHLHPGPRESAQSMADILLIHPVSSRRLLNAVDRLLLKQDDDVIFCGPFAINRSRRILLAHGQETQLTPKQALLVELFFSNPGATLDRRTLMERVWQTDYMGDTRTLDVHIRWVREMLEADPSHPIYLRTVRGVGYRLELNVNGLAKST